MGQFHATTIVAVRRSEDDICIGGDGQVTMGESAIMKAGAKKVQKIYRNSVLVGFAGSVADAFSLREKFEEKLEEHTETNPPERIPQGLPENRILQHSDIIVQPHKMDVADFEELVIHKTHIEGVQNRVSDNDKHKNNCRSYKIIRI